MCLSVCLSVDSYSRARTGYEAVYEQYYIKSFIGTSERRMKSTKVQNPRRIYNTAYQANNAPSLATPRGVYSTTTRSVLAVTRASCIGMGKAEPATRPSKTILHDALKGKSAK